MDKFNWTVRNRNSQKFSQSEHFFYFFLIFKVFSNEKIELPTLKNEKKLKMQIKILKKCPYCSEKFTEQKCKCQEI